MPAAPSGGMAKESEPHITFTDIPELTEVGKEMPLPAEVVQAGVTMHPTSVPIPPAVARMGVTQVGHTAPVAPAVAIALPLSDDQIAEGLHQGIISSWRWLAEWCVRQLKQAHVMVKTIHGKIVRTEG